MRSLPSIVVAGIAISFGPASSLAFLPSPKSVRLPTISSSRKVEGPSPSSCVNPIATISSATRPTSTTLDAVAPEVLTSFISPAMGFVKSEWTVSYGYGFGTAISALSLLSKQGRTLQPTVATLHAAALIFYGFRLNAFLFIRNRMSPTYREIGEMIEKKSQERYATRISRAPFILSCGLLYYGLYLPVLLTSKLASDGVAVKSAAGPGLTALKVLVGMQWFGYLVAALGDLTKSYVKASEKRGKFLVTSGIFSVVRHPNFSGEILSWTCNALCGALSAGYLLRSKFSLPVVGYLGLSTIGWSGIVFVLLGATKNLENRQQKEHGDTEKYKEWVKSSWCGWKLPEPKKSESEEETHEITMNADVEEGFGSGI